MTANRELPTLNPLKARSTVATILVILSTVAPVIGFISPGWVAVAAAEIVSNEDLILANLDQFVMSVNGIIGAVGVVWLWIERRAPHFRLSLNK